MSDKTNLAVDWRAIDWRAITLSALVLFACVWVVISFVPIHQGPNYQANTRAAQESDGDVKWWGWPGSLEALFTGLIALYAVLQYRESRRSAERQLRAYVHVAAAKVHNLHKADNRYIVVEIQNFGQTPAINYRFRCGAHVREWPLQSILREPPEDLRVGTETLPPSRKSIMQIGIDELSEWEECTLRDWRAGVYFWGLITYEDIFGKQRFTRVRMVCEGQGLSSGFMHPTEDGNESN